MYVDGAEVSRSAPVPCDDGKSCLQSATIAAGESEDVIATAASPKQLTTVKINIDPYLGFTTPEVMDIETRNPANIGPRPFATLPPNMAKPFVFAR